MILAVASILAGAITRYVALHPNASDTLEGVGRWWVASEAVTASPELLQRVLDELVDADVLTRRTLPDGRTIYAAGTSTRPIEWLEED